MPKKILMVCLGNICRSPLAEGILRSKLSNDFIVDSAGTGGWHAGEQPDKRSILTARNRGIDIAHQKARKFQKSDFDNFDYIYVMDNQNFKDVDLSSIYAIYDPMTDKFNFHIPFDIAARYLFK